MGHLPKSECRLFSRTPPLLDRPTLRSARPELPGQPRAVHVFLARRNPTDEGARLYPGRRFTRTTGRRRSSPSTSTPSSGQADARRRERLHHTQPRSPGPCSTAARCSSPVSGESTTCDANSSHYGTVNLTKGALYTARFSVRSAPRTRAEIQTPSTASDSTACSPEERRSGRVSTASTPSVEPRIGLLTCCTLRRPPPRGKAECKRAAADRGGSSRSPGGSVDRSRRTTHVRRGVDVFAQILRGLLDLDLQVVL